MTITIPYPSPLSNSGYGTVCRSAHAFLTTTHTYSTHNPHTLSQKPETPQNNLHAPATCTVQRRSCPVLVPLLACRVRAPLPPLLSTVQRLPREKKKRISNPLPVLEQIVSNLHKNFTRFISLKLILESFQHTLSRVKHFHLPECPTWRTPIQSWSTKILELESGNFYNQTNTCFIHLPT